MLLGSAVPAGGAEPDARPPAGNFAYVGSRCAAAHQGGDGVQVVDIADPRRPRLVSIVGCHEIDAVRRADGKVLVACARNLVDHRRSDGATALHLIDATTPRSPTPKSPRAASSGGIRCAAHACSFR